MLAVVQIHNNYIGLIFHLDEIPLEELVLFARKVSFMHLVQIGVCVYYFALGGQNVISIIFLVLMIGLAFTNIVTLRFLAAKPDQVRLVLASFISILLGLLFVIIIVWNVILNVPASDMVAIIVGLIIQVFSGYILVKFYKKLQAAKNDYEKTNQALEAQPNDIIYAHNSTDIQSEITLDILELNRSVKNELISNERNNNEDSKIDQISINI